MSLCNAYIVDVVAHSFLFVSFFFNLKVLVTSGVYFGSFFLIFCDCFFFSLFLPFDPIHASSHYAQIKLHLQTS